MLSGPNHVLALCSFDLSWRMLSSSRLLYILIITIAQPNLLTLHLNTSRSMQHLARAVRPQRRSKMHIARRHLDGHTGPIQWASTHTQRIHGARRVVLRRRLQRRPNNTGRNSVNPNPVRRLLLRETTGEGCDSALGRRVVEKHGVGHVGRDGSAVHNAVTALHVLEGVFGHGEHGDDVCVERLFCYVEVDFCNVCAGFLHGGCLSC
jgi:hypothetical protein